MKKLSITWNIISVISALLLVSVAFDVSDFAEHPRTATLKRVLAFAGCLIMLVGNVVMAVRAYRSSEA